MMVTRVLCGRHHRDPTITVLDLIGRGLRVGEGVVRQRVNKKLRVEVVTEEDLRRGLRVSV